MHFVGYEILEQIRQDAGGGLYKAKRGGDGAPVLIKLTAHGELGRRRVAELRHEHRILSRLPTERVVRALELLERDDQTALVLEDFGGAPVAPLAEGGLALRAFLDIAIPL